jgi:hypothetical protein
LREKTAWRCGVFVVQDYVLSYDESWSSNELLAYFLSIYCAACLLASTSDNLRRLVITLIGLRCAKHIFLEAIHKKNYHFTKTGSRQT